MRAVREAHDKDSEEIARIKARLEEEEVSARKQHVRHAPLPAPLPRNGLRRMATTEARRYQNLRRRSVERLPQSHVVPDFAAPGEHGITGSKSVGMSRQPYLPRGVQATRRAEKDAGRQEYERGLAEIRAEAQAEVTCHVAVGHKEYCAVVDGDD